jgi:hypothetical protein
MRAWVGTKRRCGCAVWARIQLPDFEKPLPTDVDVKTEHVDHVRLVLCRHLPNRRHR